MSGLGRDGAGSLGAAGFLVFAAVLVALAPDVWASTAATSGAGSALKAPVKAFQDLLNGSGGQLAILLAVCVGAGAAAVWIAGGALRAVVVERAGP